MTTDINKQIPQGYKLTEVGIIPKDWDVKTLGEVGQFSKGQGIKKNETASGSFLCIRYGELYTKHNNYVKQFYSFISRELTFVATRLKYGDILFAGSGETKEEIGKAVAFLYDLEAYAGGDIVILSPQMEIVNSLFLGFLLNISWVQKQKSSRGQGDAVVHISATQLSAIQIPLPPLAEQQRIAQILSDADMLLQHLDALIAKKQAIKQGTMQELLRPKEGWEVKTLGEVAEVLDNLRKPLNDSQRQKMQGDIPYCGANGIVGFVNEYLIDSDIILVAEDGGYFDEYKTRPIAYRMSGKCWVNNHAHILKSKKGISQDFLFYSLVHKNILDFIVGGTRAKLNKSSLISISIPLPTLEHEQERIAQILSDIDKELEALEAKRAKYTAIKAGLMQSLLTGAVRV